MNETQAANKSLLSTEDAAVYLTLSPRTLEKWRKERGAGPAFVKMGRTVRYLTSALDDFIATSAYSSTAEASQTSRALQVQSRPAALLDKSSSLRRVRPAR